MGVLQALEAIKLLTAKPVEDYSSPSFHPPSPTLLMFSAYSSPPFRSVRLRSRRKDCAVCSAAATITAQSLTTGSLDYVAFCGTTFLPNSILPPNARISASAFARLPRDGSNTLIDVRDETQFAMCALRGAVNVPWNGNAEAWVEAAMQREEVRDGRAQACYVVCRMGNDSQLAARALMEKGLVFPGGVRHVEGGFRAWREEVDGGWPEY
jgi:adenylyltransferase/sulfurtransferase